MRFLFLTNILLWLYPISVAFCSSMTDEILQKADSCLKIPDYPCALGFYELSMDAATNPWDQVKINLGIANIRYKTGMFDEAYQLYYEALQLADSENMIEEKAFAQQGLAHILWRSGDNIKATNFIIESIENFRKVNEPASLIRSSNILAGIYMSVGNLDDAEKIYRQMLEIARQISDSVNMAQTYEYIGALSFYRAEYQQAFLYYEQALSINLLLQKELEVGITYSNIAETLNALARYEQALVYIQKGESIMVKHNFTSGLIFLYYCMGDSYTYLKKYNQGIKCYQKSLSLMKISGETREAGMVYAKIAENFAFQGNYKEAYRYHQLHSEVNDSLFTSTKNKQLEEIKAKYDLEKKVQENFYLSKENQVKAQQLIQKEATIRRQYIMGALLVLLLTLALYLALKLYRNKQLLSKANKAKATMFGFIAHDLLSPIGSIKSLIDILVPGAQFNITKEERTDMMLGLQNSSNEVLELLKDLLMWSVSQHKGYDFTPERMNLKSAAEKNVALFTFQISSKSLKIHDDIPNGLHCMVDPRVILTIIRNLISNAIKFTPKDGVIRLYAEETATGTEVLFSVTDSGIGMTSEQLETILSEKKFNSKEGTENEKGSGLGFNLVKDFVRESGGRLSIISQLDIGTTVKIYLPKG